jgi:hypothetical protein
MKLQSSIKVNPKSPILKLKESLFNKVDALPVDFLQQINKKDNHNFNVGKNYPL